MKRRDLLRTVSTAWMGASALPVNPQPDPQRAPTDGAGVQTELADCTAGVGSDEPLSLRCLGKRLDPLREADRLGGNRPPELRDAGTDVDTFTRYYLPVDQKEWNDQSKEALEDRRRRLVRRHARDLGLAHREDKGVFELHRFASAPDPASVRELSARHRSGTEFSLLVFNAGLFRAAGFATQYADINQRKWEIGTMLKDEEYDIVGLNEVWFNKQQHAVLQNAGEVEWWGSPPGNDGTAPDNNGLMTLLLDNDTGPTPAQVDSTHGFYGFFEAAGLDQIVRKGWHHTRIDLGHPGKLDFFVTHLNHAQGKPKYREARLSQIDTLVEAIADHSEAGNVTIVGGDFNVLGNRAEYDEMIKRLDDRLGLQDVWLTRGGEIAKTSWFDDHQFWPENGDPPDWPWDCQNYHEDCYCDAYVDTWRSHTDGSVRIDRNARLDYLFVEAPKQSHDVTLDVSRVRRKLFPRLKGDVTATDADERKTKACATEMVDCPTGSTHCYTEPYLSDHMGLELEIVASSG